MRQIDKISSSAAALLADLKGMKTATREEAVRLEDAITQAEALCSTIQRLAKDSARAFIPTTKNAKELRAIFGNLYHGGFLGAISKKASAFQEAESDFLAMFESAPGARQGRAVWKRTYRNKLNKKALVDFLTIAGIQRGNIIALAAALFIDKNGKSVAISSTTISGALAYEKGSADHEALSRIWAGESIEDIFQQ